MNTLAQSIAEATQEVFETMAMIHVQPGDPLLELIEEFENTVTGVVGLAGTCQGILSIHVPFELAKTIAGNFLGMEVDEIDDDVKDIVGELANMIAGSVKLAITDKGKDIQLSIPNVVAGEKYTSNHIKKARWAAVTFSMEGGEFLVDLKYRKEEEKTEK